MKEEWVMLVKFHCTYGIESFSTQLEKPMMIFWVHCDIRGEEVREDVGDKSIATRGKVKECKHLVKRQDDMLRLYPSGRTRL